MKLKHGFVLVIFIYITEQVAARHSELANILENLHLSNNKNPLIVVLNPHKEVDNVLVDSRDHESIYVTEDNGVFESINAEAEAKEEAKSLLYNYLLRTGHPKNTEEEIEDDKRSTLREALRSRCRARAKCEKKCDNDDDEDYRHCPRKCKAEFDRLNLCEPPKKKENKCKKQGCGKKGKTMPPAWPTKGRIFSDSSCNSCED